MIGWTLRVLIAVMFGWSAFAKARRGCPPVIERPGMPPLLVAASGPALVAAEAGTAVLVLIPATHAIGGICTAVLGITFAGVLVARWIRGSSRLSCACFGSPVERPAWLLTTRAVLLTIAGLLIAADVDPAVSRTGLVDVALVVLALAVVALAILVLALYRHVGVLERRLGPRSALELADEGPPFGQRAPELTGLTHRGSELIAFGSDNCRLCRELTPGFRALARDGLAVRGVDEHAEPDAFDRFRVPGTPYVVHLYDGVVVAKGLVNTLEQIEELVGVGLERAQHAQ